MTTQHSPDDLAPAVVRQYITDAYIYAYPLVLMDATRKVATAPVNSFYNSSAFVDADFHDVVRPNCDTLYSQAWLDVSEEPIVLDLPDTRGRYIMMPVLSGWTDVVACPGKRTTGSGAQSWLIKSASWIGAVPADLTDRQITVPTGMAWIIGRTACDGTPQDYEAVHKLQAQYRLTPLSQWGTTGTVAAAQATAPESTTAAGAAGTGQPTPPQQVAALTPDQFFQKFADLLPANPPAPADALMVSLLHQLGIVPSANLDWGSVSPATRQAISQGVARAQALMVQYGGTLSKSIDGWSYSLPTIARFGTEYFYRAVVALGGLGANPIEEAMYLSCTVDSAGQPLDGNNSYQLAFPRWQAPPAYAFWSVTAYDAEGYFIPNADNKYAVHDWDSATGSDGVLRIYLQASKPTDPALAQNWLPVASGTDSAFNLTIRIYWPMDQALDGGWLAPAVTKLA